MQQQAVGWRNFQFGAAVEKVRGTISLVGKSSGRLACPIRFCAAKICLANFESHCILLSVVAAECFWQLQVVPALAALVATAELRPS